MTQTINWAQERDSLNLASKIVQVLTGNSSVNTSVTVSGGNIKYFNIAGGFDYKASSNPTSWNLILESFPDIDSYQTTDPSQKYRMAIMMTIDPTKDPMVVTSFKMVFGDETQIQSTSSNTIQVSPLCPVFYLWNATRPPSASSEYQVKMALTTRGFSMVACPTTNINGVLDNSTRYNSFICVQRPVNPSNGATNIDGAAPIFLLSKSTDSSDTIFDFAVIRDKNLPATSPISKTSRPTADSASIYKWSMDWQHPNLFDDYSHIIKFPYGFKTPTSLYMDELDLICFVNATAFAGDQNVSITMYGESAPRQYTTDWGIVQYGQLATDANTKNLPRVISGARVGVLTNGGGI